jgi:transposase
MKYTIKHFRKDFPTDDRCLDYIFRSRFPDRKGWYRVSTNMTYVHGATGRHTSPLAGTIFQKSTTALTLWFYAIYLFSVSKNGVSSRELQRHLGVTLKTAWRMASQIRKLMEQGGDPLSGIVEADETYINGKPILGAVERGGAARVKATENRKLESVIPFLGSNVAKGARLVTDNAPVYVNIKNVKHRPSNTHKFTKGKFAAPTSMEAFWSNLKRSIAGTHHYVSPKHLQSYLDFFAFQYAHRASEVPPFLALLALACR